MKTYLIFRKYISATHLIFERKEYVIKSIKVKVFSKLPLIKLDFQYILRKRFKNHLSHVSLETMKVKIQNCILPKQNQRGLFKIQFLSF